MELDRFDAKCVRVTTGDGEVYEGTASYISPELAFHEYGEVEEEALMLFPLMFYKSDIVAVESLEDVDGPFGHFTEKYGKLELDCLEWGTDMVEEILETDDETGILRMLLCIDENLQPGSGPISSDELACMLRSLIKYNKSERVVSAANELLLRFGGSSAG